MEMLISFSSRTLAPAHSAKTTSKWFSDHDITVLDWQIVVTPDTDWFSDALDPQYSKTAHVRVAFYCGQPKAHLCNNHAVWSASWYATPVRWMDYLGKGEVLTNTDLDRFVNNIWEK